MIPPWAGRACDRPFRMHNKHMDRETADIIVKGGAGVFPTDTLYGIVASAFDRAAVELIYELKGRDKGKPFIILVSSLDDLKRFKAKLGANERDFLVENWPASLSAIVPVEGDDFEYLHRGTGSLAFRMPADERLQALLRETGPLVAPSANPQGAQPASTVEEARGYFGAALDFYIDGGVLSGEPSTLVDLRQGKMELVRPGAHKLRID